MKCIVLGILFLWTFVWSLNTIGESIVPVETIVQTEQQPESEARPHVNQMISVLAEANSKADLSVSPINPLPTNLVRRYRPGVFYSGCLFIYLRAELATISNPIFKSFLELSRLYAAHLKDVGYYVYTLRKIIV